jgi:hypothetical protein
MHIPSLLPLFSPCPVLDFPSFENLSLEAHPLPALSISALLFLKLRKTPSRVDKTVENALGTIRSSI